MDILSHGLWGALYGKAVNTQLEKPVHLGWAFWWGIFPDIFAFAPSFVWALVLKIRGQTPFWERPMFEGDIWSPGFSSMHDFTQLLYSMSHSLVVWALVVGIFWAITKQFPWVLIPWAFHIVCDIPTHSKEFYATPVLWPVSDWKFMGGFQWGQWWFMLTNWGLLLLAYLAVRFKM
jgi:hypothetical protein